MTSRAPQGISVVVSTYNNPRALALVLQALARQSVSDFEIIIGDDGSGPETREVVQAFASTARQRVVHLWQEDEGVRRATMANKSVLAASGDYLVFLDGDCLTPKHWLATHLAHAERGWFVSGGKVLMDERLTQDVFAGRVAPERLERLHLRWRHIHKGRRLVMSRIPGLRWLTNRNLQRRAGWVGEDSSTFAEHLHAVGGFDERFTLLWDDADVSERLKAAGVRGRSIRYLAPILHLEHGRSYRNPEADNRNLQLFLQNQAEGVVTTPHGLARHR